MIAGYFTRVVRDKRELNEPLRGDVRRDGSPGVRSHLLPRCPLPRAGLGLYDERRTILPGSGRPPRVAWGTTRPALGAEPSFEPRHSWHVRERRGHLARGPGFPRTEGQSPHVRGG